jgi:hypothetical protein
MSDQSILWPIFAMVLLVAFVLTRLASTRLRAVQSGEMRLGFYRLFQGGEEPERLRATTRHMVNLFELPVLFYVACILAYVTGLVNGVLVVLAWLFVAARYLHAYVHLTSNSVPTRFRVFGASFILLMLMWVVLAYQLALSP